MQPESGTSSAIVLTVAGAYLAVCLVIGMWPSRRTSDSAAGYVAGDRTLGLLLMYFITGATIFSAFAFLGAPGWAFSKGVAAFYVIAYGVVGFVPFYFLGPRASRLGREHGFVTQAEMVAHRFGMPAIAGVMALISVFAFVPYLGLQMKGAGYVLGAMTHGALPEWAGSLIVYGIVTTYVLKSGVLGVGWTNVFQGVFMMVLAWVLGLYLPYRLYGGVGEMFQRLAAERPELLDAPGLTATGEPWTWAGYSSVVTVSIIGFSCWPHLFMKAFSARDEHTLRRTVVLYPTFQIFLVPILLIGFAGVLSGLQPERSDQILPMLLMNLELPAVVVGLFCAGALAASMSSGDAISHATASILVRDGWITAFGQRLGSGQERAAIRILLVVVMAGAYVFAITSEDSLVTMLLYAYGSVAQFAPALVATLCWRRATGPGVLAGLVGGLITNLVCVRYAGGLYLLEIHTGLYGLAMNALLLVVVSLATRARDPQREAEFLRVAGTERPAGEA